MARDTSVSALALLLVLSMVASTMPLGPGPEHLDEGGLRMESEEEVRSRTNVAQ